MAGNPPKIVDGKRRLKACGMAGVQPKYRCLREAIEPAGYVWAKNGERRDLTKSQKALAAAELSSFSGPGRPRKEGGNSAVLQNFPAITLGGVAVQGGFSTRLLSDAAKVADKDGPAVQELREGRETRPHNGNRRGPEQGHRCPSGGPAEGAGPR